MTRETREIYRGAMLERHSRRLSRAAHYEVVGELAKMRGAVAVTVEFTVGARGEFLREGTGFFDAEKRGIGGFLLRLIFSCGFAEGRGRFFDVEKIVDDLKGPADGFAETAEAGDVLVGRPADKGSSDDRSANKRGSLRAMNVFERGGVDGLAFRLDVGDLAADHAVDGASGAADFGDDANAAIGRDVGVGKCFERKSEQGVTRENGHGNAEFFVARGLAAAKVVVVEGGQIVVNE